MFKTLIITGKHAELINDHALELPVRLSFPSPEHDLPLLYILALKQPGQKLTFLNDILLAGSLSMTSIMITPEG